MRNKQEVLELFKQWHAKFFKEWRKEQVSALVRAVRPDLTTDVERQELVNNVLSDKDLLVPQITSSGNEISFVCFHHRQRHPNEKGPVMIYNTQQDTVQYFFGYWDVPHASERHRMPEPDAIVARLKKFPVPYDVFVSFINESNNVNELKMKMVDYERNVINRPRGQAN